MSGILKDMEVKNPPDYKSIYWNDIVWQKIIFLYQQTETEGENPQNNWNGRKESKN